MLILTFRNGEDAVISLPNGEEIVVRLVEVDRNRARIGFDAHPDIVIDRRMVYERKLAQRLANEHVAEVPR